MNTLKVHEPGECFDRAYGRNCNGIAEYTINPYVKEIHGEDEWEWICEGRYEGMCMDV